MRRSVAATSVGAFEIETAAGAQGVVVRGLSGVTKARGWYTGGENMAELNGTYWPDEDAKQKPGYLHIAGKWTILSTGTCWCLAYGGRGYYYASATTPLRDRQHTYGYGAAQC